MAHDALDDLFANTAWRNDGVLVVDLPPGTGDVVLTTLREVPVDGMVVVTTPFHASVSDTARTVELFRDNGVPVLGAVVNMAEYVCDCCDEPNELFSDDAVGDLDAPVLAELPFTHDLQGTPEQGRVPAPMAELATAAEEAIETADEVDIPAGAQGTRPGLLRRPRQRGAVRPGQRPGPDAGRELPRTARRRAAGGVRPVRRQAGDARGLGPRDRQTVIRAVVPISQRSLEPTRRSRVTDHNGPNEAVRPRGRLTVPGCLVVFGGNARRTRSVLDTPDRGRFIAAAGRPAPPRSPR